MQVHSLRKRVTLLVLVSAAGVWPVAAMGQDAGTRRQTDLALFASGARWESNVGTEFPGAKGSFSLEQQEGKSVGVVSFNFAGGGLYVAGVRQLEIPASVREIRLKAKSDNATRVLVRLFDDTKQCHQWLLPYDKAGEWQLLRLPLGEKATQHFGGRNDGRIHLPARSLWLGVEKTRGAVEGKLSFSDLIAIEVVGATATSQPAPKGEGTR